MGDAGCFGTHLPNCGANGMKYGVVFLNQFQLEFWIFHGQPKIIFKKNIQTEKDFDLFFQKIPSHLPLFVIFSASDFSFERIVLKGVSKLNQKDQTALAKTHLKKVFPQAIQKHFVFLEDSLILSAILFNDFYQNIFTILKTKNVIGTSCETLFFSKITNNKNGYFLFVQKNDFLGEWIVENKNLIYGRKVKNFIDSDDFLNSEKEKLRRFLNLPNLELQVLDENAHSFMVQNCCFDFTFSPYKTKFNFIYPFVEKIMILIILILIFYGVFLIKEIKQKNDRILFYSNQLDEMVLVLNQAEFLSNEQKINPYFLNQYKERDLFWKAKDSQNFEIFLPLTVEKNDFSHFQIKEKEDGFLILGNAGELP